ncbi:hypothetical protein L1987_88868 [Smallanthus sonchifolius]|nr:hypothetical protein L1987_88868 [Smallanthus sonchifolius]
MFPTYPLVIPMIPRCTYSPQPSVQIYLGYGHCTPIVVSPISASIWVEMARAEMTGRSRPIENRGMTMYSFPYGAHGVAYFERGRRGNEALVERSISDWPTPPGKERKAELLTVNDSSYSYSMDMLAFGMKMDEQALEPGTDEIRALTCDIGTGHYTGGRDMTATLRFKYR